VLRELAIRDFAIVEDVQLALEEGFTAVTGETGAGKSILVDALSLLSGGRASAEMLRHQAERLRVSARFETGGGIRSELERLGLVDDGELVVRREFSADGRGRVSVNDEPATARTASFLGDLLLTIHGQGDERHLTDAEAAIRILDDFAGLEAFAARVAEAARALSELESRARELDESRRDRERRLEALQYEIREIDAARLDGVDEEALAGERNRLLHADRIRQLGSTALSALSEDEGSAADRLGEAHRALADLARIDPALAEAEREAADLKARVSDLAGAVRPAATEAEADPGRLTKLESRLEKLSRLKKKYGTTVGEILDWRERAARQAGELAGLDDALARAERERDLALAAYDTAAGELSKRRRTAAARFSALVQKELGDLAMEKAKFRLELSERPERRGPLGNERGTMLFAPNPGEPEKPLARIASGGELSRVQLAIESARLAGKASRPARTLVFDEVDAGIGGRVAEVVGRKLKSLSARDQVLCVTHVPQIAARADRHFRAVKSVSGGRTRAHVEELEGAARVEEIARMLAGETVTDTARRHARALLESR
jgi:DNA repair protein RecN (Recombination protein N)